MRVHAPARPAASLADGDRQRGARAPESRRLPRRSPARGASAVRALRARRVRALATLRALRGHEAADRVPAHPARRQAGAAARRALRLARRDHPGRDAGVAGPGAGRRVTHHDPGHARRRGGPVPVRPGGGALGPPGAPGGRAARARATRPAARRHGHLAKLHDRPRASARRPAGGQAMRRWLAPVAIVVALLGLWELAARLDVLANALHIEPFLVPAPSDIANSLWSDRTLLADNGWVTLKEVLGGFALSVVAGVSFAVALHLSPTLRRAFYPLLIASQTVPIVVIAPILVVWLGFGIGPKLVIIALICFFPITVNTLDGLGSVDLDLVKMVRTLDASRWQTLRRVEAPTALPYFFSGAKIAVAVAVIGAVFGEWAGSSSGLGHLIQEASAPLEAARTFAAVTVLSALAILLFALLSVLERRVAWWGSREPRT